MDMGRTAVNTLGNCLATAIIGKWEGEVDFEKADREALSGVAVEVATH
jgi:proton glutamate symport protein